MDKYVPGEIVSASRKTRITVENCTFTMIAYGPNTSVYHGSVYLRHQADSSRLLRMDSWKGATTLSLCFDDACYSAEEAKTFLKFMASFMLTFAK